MYRFNPIRLLISVVFCVLIFTSISAEILEASNAKSFEGMPIDSVVIENRNIYNTELQKYNNFLFKTANKLHKSTLKRIIEREILLKKGDAYSQELAEETARILRQRFILYDAWIEKEIYENNKLLIRVITIDRWSLSAGVDFQREGNENKIKIGLLEKNLLGRNKLVSYHFINRTNEGSYSDASIIDRRLFGKQLIGHTALSTNPTNKFTLFALNNPYVNLNQKFGFNISTLFKNGRTDYYTDDSLVNQNFYKGNKTRSEIFYRFGSYQTKYLFSLNYIYNFENNNSDYLLQESIEDTLFHAFEIGFGYSKYDYEKKHNIDGYNYTEDFNNGVEVFFEHQNAYSFKDDYSLYKVNSLNMRKDFITTNSLSMIQSIYKNWYNSSQSLRTLRGLNIKYYNQSIPKIVLAFNIEYLSDKSSQSLDLVSLGGTTGLRGVDKYFLTGDKRFVLNSEVRLLPTVSILSFNFGVAVFGDIANVLQTDENFKLSNMYTSIGTGLRIAFDRSSRNIVRIDFAYTQSNNWQISFGTGQYFQARDRF